MIVEIDEALIAKQRNAQGNETNTFYSIVPDRTAATLTDLIKQKIRRVQRILSDELAGYHDIRALDMDYEHQTVNHSHNFVSPLDPNVHTKILKIVKKMLREC
ncbi:hypothetical protein ROZALSC1DRAFT_27991 [Rozella allomycis CSF55]|uniref:ISXO2-like transposase domain-containing protein n=1 Tax=Rozella allomycis (strain CSF55) TaxID=988480 RepID=A0A075AT82_ROZAC|nr:hypothetical protein O9G_003241 [Rozella allomycis CSF55]RKP20528.1 hypothetical protein ROZALSC1DRAFT_27991 [Rozella allomycis CSF55]|eukprot:EPZ33380.1 hypothetical protein O9G_003241 [Rozella allomycis CSF55]